MLLLVRHGQASFGAADYDVLSERGRSQARRLGSHLETQGTRPRALVHGAMRRQSGTAEEMRSAAGWEVRPVTDERWDEFDHVAVLGRYADRAPEGLDRRGFQTLFEEATGRWVAADEVEGVESWAEFTARVRSALDDVAQHAGPGATATVVTSGGVIAAAAAALIGAAGETVWQRLNAVLVNGSVTRVLVGATGMRLLSFNEHAFLPPELVTYR
jgi:broad specificity phosphatase PhoE